MNHEPTPEDTLTKLAGARWLFAGLRDRLGDRLVTAAELDKMAGEVAQAAPLPGDDTSGEETAQEWLQRLKADARDLADAGNALRPALMRMISEDTFEGVWPFTVSEGLLIGTAGRAVTFISPDGAVYGLNGHAHHRGALRVDPIWKPAEGDSMVWKGDVLTAGLELVKLADAEEARVQAEQQAREVSPATL